jgi:hypothetical protein
MNRYKCPGCKLLIYRDSKTPTLKSFCATPGKDVIMKLVKKKKVKK